MNTDNVEDEKVVLEGSIFPGGVTSPMSLALDSAEATDQFSIPSTAVGEEVLYEGRGPVGLALRRVQ